MAVGFVAGATAADTFAEGVVVGRGSFRTTGRASVAEGCGEAVFVAISLAVAAALVRAGGGVGMDAVVDGAAGVCTALTGVLGVAVPLPREPRLTPSPITAIAASATSAIRTVGILRGNPSATGEGWVVGTEVPGGTCDDTPAIDSARASCGVLLTFTVSLLVASEPRDFALASSFSYSSSSPDGGGIVDASSVLPWRFASSRTRRMRGVE